MANCTAQHIHSSKIPLLHTLVSLGFIADSRISISGFNRNQDVRTLMRKEQCKGKENESCQLMSISVTLSEFVNVKEFKLH